MKEFFAARPNIQVAVKQFIVLFSFVLPISVLYILNPRSFEVVWKARTPYIIFLWLFGLELAMAWRRLQSKIGYSNHTRTLATLVVMAIPTAYVIGISFLGLNNMVVELGKFLGVPYQRFGSWLILESWPTSFEYLVLAASFTLIILLAYAKNGLKEFLVALSFLWATTFFFLIDAMAPYGVFWVLQAFVPLTATSSAAVLQRLGYQTIVQGLANGRGPGTLLVAIGEGGVFPVAIYWPSAGIHSLFIYSLTILLFLRNATFSLPLKILCVVIGALGTFMANVLRIATICMLGLQIGRDAAVLFHDYYGELFFISWMIIYLVLIFAVQQLIRSSSRLKGSSSSPVASN